jgi:hypothetical protein
MRMSAGHNIALIFPGDVWPENAIGLLSGHLSPRGGGSHHESALQRMLHALEFWR